MNKQVKEQIRAEVERRKKICEGVFERESDTYYQGKAVAYGELLSFIDSLPDEQQSKDLEEAAEEYEKNHTYQRYDGGGFTPEYDATLAEAFLAGARLQKKQDTADKLKSDFTVFNKCYEQGKKDIISIIESRISEIIGDAQPKPVLRAELQELIKRIKEEQK